MDINIQIESWDGWKISWATMDNLSELQVLLCSGAIDGVGVSPYKGYQGGDLEFLKQLSMVRCVIVPFAENIELEVLLECSGIEFICVGERIKKFDFSVFPALIGLRLKWVPGDVLPNPLSGLESLYIRDFKSKNKDIGILSAYGGLKSLEIVSANITSVEGISRLKSLSSLSLCFCRGLIDVSDLVGVDLKFLNFEACKKIKNFEILVGCYGLKVLRVENCGALNSLRFMSGFRVLEEFRFVNTKIIDGDMTPLFKLKRVGFVSNKEYSHTPEQVRAVIDGSR